MSQPKITRAPNETDRLIVRELFSAMPLIERGKPILAELSWVLQGRKDSDQHRQMLPDYCYNIFDVWLKTYFKGIPSLADTVAITDQAGMATAKTLEATKQVLRLDWRNLGKVVGIVIRCVRFADLEAEAQVKSDGFDNSTDAGTKESLIGMIMGRQWVQENQNIISCQPTSALFTGLLNESTAASVETLANSRVNFGALAYQWGPGAMAEFNQGMAEGVTSFLDEHGQLAGESSRSGIYAFLLLVWPEIKVMLEASPKKTLSELHDWMRPFMRVGLTAYIEIETLRDVCAPPPSGIGLSLRPLKSARRKASA